MKIDASIRLAVAAVASVFLFTSCPSPVVKPKPVEPPAPEYKVQYSYLKSDGTESDTPTDIRLYRTTKDGIEQTGYAVTRFAQPGIHSILFTDDIENDNADYLQLFFVSGADLPFRIVNRFTTTDEAGTKTQETVVGIPSRYDNATQSFDVTFSSIDNRSDTLVLQSIKLNKEIFNLKDNRNGSRPSIQPLVVSKAATDIDRRRSGWSYLDYLLVAGTCVAYAMQHRLQSGEAAWSETPSSGSQTLTPALQASHLTPLFGWNNFWKNALKVVCALVAVVAFTIAVVATPAAVVAASATLGAVAVASNVVGAAALVGIGHLEADEKYDPDSSMEAPVILIWEVDENGDPLDVPESKLENNGTVHLHTETEKKEVILKIQTIGGTWPSLAVVKSKIVEKMEHKIEASTDIRFSTALLDEKTNEAAFYKELYVRITSGEIGLVPTELSSYILLHFQGLPQGVYANINGEPAILDTQLEDTNGMLEQTSRKYGNIFKVNICDLVSFHTNS